jgi:hypothetical protein
MITIFSNFCQYSANSRFSQETNVMIIFLQILKVFACKNIFNEFSETASAGIYGQSLKRVKLGK